MPLTPPPTSRPSKGKKTHQLSKEHFILQIKSLSKPSGPTGGDNLLKTLGNHSLKYERVYWQVDRYRGSEEPSQGPCWLPSATFRTEAEPPSCSRPAAGLPLTNTFFPSCQTRVISSGAAPGTQGLSSLRGPRPGITPASSPRHQPRHPSEGAPRAEVSALVPSPGCSLGSCPSSLDQPQSGRLWKLLIRTVPPVCRGPLSLIWD